MTKRKIFVNEVTNIYTVAYLVILFRAIAIELLVFVKENLKISRKIDQNKVV